ncbi:MAG: hypothetical protein K0Q73_5198 [Paenibacillus sp.]|jgi:hypothetical protein|nr:hypothetical protein [Paenibacillus sp.]
MMRRVWDQALVAQEMKKRIEAGEPMNSTAVKKSDKSLYSAIYEYYHTYDNLLIHLGIDPATVKNPATSKIHGPIAPKEKIIAAFSQEDMIAAIQAAAKSMGHRLRIIDYDAWVERQTVAVPTSPQITYEFRSWTLAKQSAGLKVSNIPLKYSDNEINTALLSCAEVVGKGFTDADYVRWRTDHSPEAPSIVFIRRRYRKGELTKVRRELGIETRSNSEIYGKKSMFNPNEYESHLLAFVEDQLRYKEYGRWQKGHQGRPSVSTLEQRSGKRYSELLITAIERYIEKTKVDK